MGNIMNFIAYYRVSTKQQGQSGLGLDSQKRQVQDYVSNQQGKLLNEYTEIESGKKNDRTELNKAIAKAKETNSTLLIAKLDRLSRNAAFVLNLRDSGVQFIALDCPQANTLTIGIFALLAQQERELISERTKKALHELKAKGIKLGKPENLTNQAKKKGAKANSLRATSNKDSVKAYSVIVRLRKAGFTYQKIADELNANGFTTPAGKQFSRGSVHSLEKTFKESRIKKIEKDILLEQPESDETEKNQAKEKMDSTWKAIQKNQRYAARVKDNQKKEQYEIEAKQLWKEYTDLKNNYESMLGKIA
jgi:DNA invertase Pin-like site-specific DNA recombinase